MLKNDLQKGGGGATHINAQPYTYENEMNFGGGGSKLSEDIAILLCTGYLMLLNIRCIFNFLEII